MIKFLKDSFRELKHVVWPTANETKKYFAIILAVLVVFWLYVFISWSLFSDAIFFLRDLLK